MSSALEEVRGERAYGLAGGARAYDRGDEDAGKMGMGDREGEGADMGVGRREGDAAGEGRERIVDAMMILSDGLWDK